MAKRIDGHTYFVRQVVIDHDKDTEPNRGYTLIDKVRPSFIPFSPGVQAAAPPKLEVGSKLVIADPKSIMSAVSAGTTAVWLRESDLAYTFWPGSDNDRNHAEQTSEGTLREWAHSSGELVNIYDKKGVEDLVKSALNEMPKNLVQACMDELDKSLKERSEAILNQIKLREKQALEAVDVAKKQALEEIGRAKAAK
jgi:hypothetical protein